MYGILGSTGQVGTILALELLDRGESVRAIVRNAEKAYLLKEKGAEIYVADYTDVQALTEAFSGCKSVFLITPENPFSEDYLSEANTMLACYRKAVLSSGINEVVGLSSMGAQHGDGTGNLTVSNKLENLFSDTKIKTSFIRPAYYFSNWMGYFETAKENGVLPSFFPSNLKIPMIAPCDVARFTADVITHKIDFKPVYEIFGEYYCADNIAQIMGDALGRTVTTMSIPQDEWINALKQVGFSDSGANNLILMTEAVINGKTAPETEPIKLPNDFQGYLRSEGI